MHCWSLCSQHSTVRQAGLYLPWQFVCKDWQSRLSTKGSFGDAPCMTMLEAPPGATRCRLKLMLLGAVQGMGFRPFVYRLANELGLTGWVGNSPQGVCIEAEGPRASLDAFQSRLDSERPAPSFIHSCEATWLDPAGHDSFVIRESEADGKKSALVMPDIGTCPDCLREINDPANRRHRYPFTNCTHCGPRFSIIDALPYDRAHTSMHGFVMCPECAAEYHDPTNRRFHAQPNACPNCGPQLELWPGDAHPHSDRPLRNLAQGNDALLAAAHVLRCGQIVAVKGIGGFHLMVDARNEAAVRRLRARKLREEKPFALLFPTLESVRSACEVSSIEERILRSPEAPIVLLERISYLRSQISKAVAPENPYLGVMLPSNPLHHLLMHVLGFPVVATSGNLSDEPICTDEREARERLHGIADVFLVHNRPIVHHVDDSIVRVMAGREMVLRRARGYAPLPVYSHDSGLTLGRARSSLPPASHEAILAVGAQLKNSVALAFGDQVFISQHIGDLASEPASAAFRQVVSDLQQLYEVKPTVIAADLHPDYLSTQCAQGLIDKADDPLPGSGVQTRVRPALFQVQHHVAHVLSCVAENEVELPALGVAWDGTGLGTDGTIWGGEFFNITTDAVERVAHWRPFRLPGGDAAAKEPRRAALGLLYELFGATLFERTELKSVAAFQNVELAALRTMLVRGLNAPWCSSVGRLFDAVASVVGLRQTMRFEGQAAMQLEFAAMAASSEANYPLSMTPQTAVRRAGPDFILDWADMVQGILRDLALGLSPGLISAKFHNTLVESIMAVARHAACDRVVLSGGCFQNRYLTERTIHRLRADGFQPYWHQRIPTNDGGIALGQVLAARRDRAGKSPGAANLSAWRTTDTSADSETATDGDPSVVSSRAFNQPAMHSASH
jgi:hydrogenase maturation protein HypF